MMFAYLYMYICCSSPGDALASDVFHGSRSHRLAPFSTFDRDNDNWSQGSCAAVRSI